MEYSITTYTRSELESYLMSEEFQESPVWPISFHRALSHINNPRIEDNDLILAVATTGKRIIGYRTVMASYILNEGKRVRLAWISGTWVAGDYRRKGLATRLFNVIYEAWKGRLMYTNYAPASKKLYDKTGKFTTYALHKGSRFYVKSDLENILPLRYPFVSHFRALLRITDKAFNHYVLPFLTEPAMKSRLAYNVMIKSGLSGEEAELLFRGGLEGRTVDDLDWIMTFPWVIPMNDSNKVLKEKYFFSAVANPFQQYFCLVYKEGELVSIVMITLKNNQLKVPYYYSSDGDLSLIADLLFTEAWKNGMSHIDVFDESLVREMRLKTAYYAFARNQERGYMVSQEVIGEFPDAAMVRIQDGEGDVVFV